MGSRSFQEARLDGSFHEVKCCLTVILHTGVRMGCLSREMTPGGSRMVRDVRNGFLGGFLLLRWTLEACFWLRGQALRPNELSKL
jgi:hypothetical protein